MTVALTIMRDSGWQPPSLGGTIGFFEPMMLDRNYMLLGTAIESPEQPWGGGCVTTRH